MVISQRRCGWSYCIWLGCLFWDRVVHYSGGIQHDTVDFLCASDRIGLEKSSHYVTLLIPLILSFFLQSLFCIPFWTIFFRVADSARRSKRPYGRQGLSACPTSLQGSSHYSLYLRPTRTRASLRI